jgi:hypothetical protein
MRHESGVGSGTMRNEFGQEDGDVQEGVIGWDIQTDREIEIVRESEK